MTVSVGERSVAQGLSSVMKERGTGYDTPRIHGALQNSSERRGYE
jgi:hypothetical protein